MRQPVFVVDSEGNPLFQCPGCGGGCHKIWVTKPNEATGSRWQWNGDTFSPTVTPSILVRGRAMTKAGWADFHNWRGMGSPPRLGQEFEAVDTVCHSFIRDGMIEFCSDSTHELAGKTVPLPPF